MIKNNLLAFVLMFFYHSSFSQKKITWMTINELNAVYQTKPKKILFEVFSKDCHYCHDMDEKIFSNQLIANYINNTFYAVKLDAFDKTSINLGGYQYESKDGMNPLAKHLLKGNIKFPTLIFIDEKLHKINHLEGFNTLSNINLALHYFGDDAYKTTDWSAFQQSFGKQ